MNTQYTNTVKAFGRVSNAYGDAIDSLREVVGHTDRSTISNAAALEKKWQAFLTSPEYKEAGAIIQGAMVEGLNKAEAKRVILTEDYLKAGTNAQDLMRKSMQRIRAKCGYTADRKGAISAIKAKERGTKERVETTAKPVTKKPAIHSIASPIEAAKVVSAINTWRAAIDAVLSAFDSDLPEEVKELLLKASFFKVATKSKVKA